MPRLATGPADRGRRPPRRYARDGRRAAEAYRETADQLMAEIRSLYEGTG